MVDSFDAIDIDQQVQIQPFLYYKEIVVSNYRQFITFNQPYGYGFLLRYVTMNYNTISKTGLNFNNNPVLNVEFFDNVGSIARQISPVPFNMLSTPCGNVDTVLNTPISVPVPLKGFRLLHSLLNYYWPFGDAVQMQITGAGLTDLNQIALQIILEGYYVPENGTGDKNLD